jgi:nicotinate-nucleotide pyrophosphorylase (carboxylating)
MKRQDMILQAYAEDIPQSDVTTDGLGLGSRLGDARLVAKEDLVMSGMDLFSDCIRHIDPQVQLNWLFKDGDLILQKQNVCWIKGDLIKLLKAERVALNFLGRLSGIATLSRCFVQAVDGTGCRILDTRKTTPLFREYEKAAVRAGGGFNHRMNLSDAVLIKENHIRAAGSLTKAVRAIRQNTSLPIEVECSTLDEVDLALSEKVQRILLDNMSLLEMSKARARIPANVEIEASGNMTLDRVGEVAALGVDCISVGALTHSAPSADFSLLFEWSLGERK